jgi:hypothetical protein
MSAENRVTTSIIYSQFQLDEKAKVNEFGGTCSKYKSNGKLYQISSGLT